VGQIPQAWLISSCSFPPGALDRFYMVKADTASELILTADCRMA